MGDTPGFQPFKKGPSEKAENRIADALEYIAMALGTQTALMIQAHNTRQMSGPPSIHDGSVKFEPGLWRRRE